MKTLPSTSEEHWVRMKHHSFLWHLKCGRIVMDESGRPRWNDNRTRVFILDDGMLTVWDEQPLPEWKSP